MANEKPTRKSAASRDPPTGDKKCPPGCFRLNERSVRRLKVYALGKGLAAPH